MRAPISPATIDGIAQIVAQYAGESDRLGHLAPEVDTAFAQHGLYWMGLPQELGGLGLEAPEVMRLLERIAAADGSSAWCLFVHSFLNQSVVSFCADSAVDEILGGESMLMVSGQLAPVGRAVPASGGITIEGRFSFASGANEANWILAGTRHADGEGALGHVALVPSAAVRFDRTWDPIGLRGTGSWDYDIAPTFVRDGFGFSRDATTPLRGTASSGLGIVGLAEIGHIAIPLGLMRSALSEVSIAVAGKVRPGYGSAIHENSSFLREFGKLDAMYHSARAWAFAVYAEIVERLLAGEPIQERDLTRVRQVAAHVQREATDLVTRCFNWAGSRSLRNTDVLARCMRDVLAAGQHVFVDGIHLETAGASAVTQWRIGAKIGSEIAS